MVIKLVMENICAFLVSLKFLQSSQSKFYSRRRPHSIIGILASFIKKSAMTAISLQISMIADFVAKRASFATIRVRPSGPGRRIRWGIPTHRPTPLRPSTWQCPYRWGQDIPARSKETRIAIPRALTRSWTSLRERATVQSISLPQFRWSLSRSGGSRMSSIKRFQVMRYTFIKLPRDRSVVLAAY